MLRPKGILEDCSRNQRIGFSHVAVFKRDFQKIANRYIGARRHEAVCGWVWLFSGIAQFLKDHSLKIYTKKTNSDV